MRWRGETVCFPATMRFLPALAVALILVVAAAQTDEWVRDDLSDESLWLLRTSNLAREAPRAGTLPGAPDSGSQWVISKGDGPAYVVYFIPGRIHEVEIDTHRLAGATGDFTLAVSTDGKLYQPLDAGAVLLDSSFGWDYRLMASDQIPENATHLLVRFPDGSTGHSLSEVWIRYSWDDALVSRFLPSPTVPQPVQSELSMQSDAELQMLLEQLMARPQPGPEPDAPIAAESVQTAALSVLVAEPLRTPPSIEHSAVPVQPEPAIAGDELEREDLEELQPPIVAENASTEEVIETEELEEPVELAAGLPEAVTSETAPGESTPADIAATESPAADKPTVEVQVVELAISPNDAVEADPTGNSVTDPEGAPPLVVESPTQGAQSENKALIEIADTLKAAEPENTPAPYEEPERVPPPTFETTPIDVAVFETPADSSTELVAPAIEIQPSEQPEPQSEAAPTIATVDRSVLAENESATPEPTTTEVMIEIPTVGAEVVADSSPPEPAQDDSEKEWVLPTFTLPVMVTSQASETTLPTQFEPTPPAQEFTVATATKPLEVLAVAPQAASVNGSETPPIDPPSPESIAEDRSPATSGDSSPILIAAAVEPASDMPAAGLSNEDEPQQRPALKMKRTGPRSKSRGTYVARS